MQRHGRHIVVLALVAAALLAGCDDDESGDASLAVEPGAGAELTATTPTDAASTTAAVDATTVADGTTARDGVTYTSSQGDYTAVFPAEPSEQTQPQTLPDGSTMDLVIVGLETSDRFMGTARGEYPAGTEIDVAAALDGAQNQAIENVEGTLISGQDIELAGRPGREFSASMDVRGEAGTLLQRVYFDGPVVYQVIVTGAGDFGFDEPEAAAFFDSFQFTS